MTAGKLVVEITIPAAGSTNAELQHRAIAKSLLAQAAQAVGDTRLTGGDLHHDHGFGREVHGQWRYVAPIAD